MKMFLVIKGKFLKDGLNTSTRFIKLIIANNMNPEIRNSVSAGFEKEYPSQKKK